MTLQNRVCRASRGVYEVWTTGGPRKATVPGNWLHRGAELPVVGDRVELSGDRIENILPRQTVIGRKRPGRRADHQVLAANVDVAFLVTGLDTNYNVRRIERYLVLARSGGVRPVVVLNKADLCPSAESRLGEVERVARGAPVLLVSARNGLGLDEIAAQVVAGQTAVLLGSSGAGKSTILNRLLGSDAQRTREVRAGDGRGRHTTTDRELIEVPGGWYLIDTPGLRELQPWAGSQMVEESFDDVSSLAQQCRFRDCTHTGEPGCAVARSIEHGELDPARLENLRRLEREADLLAAKTDLGAALEEKDRVKKLHRMYRNVLKQKRR